MPSPQPLLREMFGAAIAAAQPELCVPPFLPERPRQGRLVVIGAGKASAEMARAAELHYGTPLEGLVVTRYGHAVACEGIEIVALVCHGSKKNLKIAVVSFLSYFSFPSSVSLLKLLSHTLYQYYGLASYWPSTRAQH